MAKQRNVNTKFWSDNYISDLNPLDRYLFLYFLTNEHTNISGIYEVPLKTIAYETGLEIDMLKKMLSRLNPKVVYIDGWVCVKNFQKHQSTKSLDVQEGIKREMANIPLSVKDKLEKWDTEGGGSIDGVGGSYIPNYTIPNLTLPRLDFDPSPLFEDKAKLAQEAAFDIFWEAYPRHTDKAVSKRRFLNLDVKLHPKIMAALEVQKKTKQWQDKDFIPQASSWLNRERWEDEITSKLVDPLEVEAKELARQFPLENSTTAEFRFSAKYGVDKLLKYKHIFGM